MLASKPHNRDVIFDGLAAILAESIEVSKANLALQEKVAGLLHSLGGGGEKSLALPRGDAVAAWDMPAPAAAPALANGRALKSLPRPAQARPAAKAATARPKPQPAPRRVRNELTGQEAAVLIMLENKGGLDAPVMLPEREVAHVLGVSKGKAHRLIQSLRNRGRIMVVVEGFPARTQWRVVVPVTPAEAERARAALPIEQDEDETGRAVPAVEGLDPKEQTAQQSGFASGLSAGEPAPSDDPGSAADGPLTDFEEELLGDLPTLVTLYPQGPCAADLAEYYGTAMLACQQAIHAVTGRGLAQLIGHQPGNSRIVPVDFEPATVVHGSPELPADARFVDGESGASASLPSLGVSSHDLDGGSPAPAVESPSSLQGAQERTAQREAVLDRYAETLETWAQIAAAIGVKKGSVGPWLTAARREKDPRVVKGDEARGPGGVTTNVVIEMYGTTDATYQGIADRVGTTVESVRVILSRGRSAKNPLVFAGDARRGKKWRPEFAEALASPEPPPAEPTASLPLQGGAPETCFDTPTPPSCDVPPDRVMVVDPRRLKITGPTGTIPAPRSVVRTLLKIQDGGLYDAAALCRSGGWPSHDRLHEALSAWVPKLAGIGVDLFRPFKGMWRVRRVEA